MQRAKSLGTTIALDNLRLRRRVFGDNKAHSRHGGLSGIDALCALIIHRRFAIDSLYVH